MLHEFDIRAQVGSGEIFLDGSDISAKITGFQVTQEHSSQPPKLVLISTHPAGTIKGQGIVEVHVFDDRLLTMLNEMNPREVEAEALSRLEWGGTNLTDKIFEVLRERLNGDQSGGSEAGGGAPAPG